MRRARSESQQIMKEQMELMRTEREIKSLLDAVRGELNKLIVEEFQLKSNEISQNIATTSTTTTSQVAVPQTEPSEKLAAQLDSTDINTQELNLTTIKTNPYSMEEEEEFFR